MGRSSSRTAKKGRYQRQVLEEKARRQVDQGGEAAPRQARDSRIYRDGRKTPVEAAAQAQAETAVLDEATANDADSQAEETICEQEDSDVAEPVEDDALKINTTEEGEERPTVEEQGSDSLPAISLTVIYDPDNANAGVTTIESDPKADASAAEQSSDGQDSDLAPVKDDTPANDSEPAKAPEKAPKSTSAAKPTPQPVEPPVPAPTPALAPAPASEPIDPAAQYPDYPVDFSTEVFCPGDILFELASLLPFGADAMGIAGEYYWIARERGTIDATRNRASFTLRYTQAGKRHEAIVHLRRHPNTPGSTWVIDQIETSEL